MHDDYRYQIEYFSNQYEEMNGYDFYQSIFPNNQNKGDMNTEYQSNAIYLYTDERDKDNKDRDFRRRIMLNDTWEDDYIEYIEGNEKAFCSGLTYRGRANTKLNARSINALIFDLDGVGKDEITNLFYRFGGDPLEPIGRTLPMPTYIVCSGSGLHLYYVFDEPIDLFPYIKLQFNSLRHDLTKRMWIYKTTSKLKKVQHQYLTQGFRMVGSTNEKYGTEVRAFQTGERVSLEYINQYVKEQSRVDVLERFSPSKVSLKQAKESYPEWYEKVIINGEKAKGQWVCHEGLYEWWKKKVIEIEGGSRYFFMMIMGVYAVKCGIPKARFKKDLYGIFDQVSHIPHTSPLTEYDRDTALKSYDKHLHLFSIDKIFEKTGVKIERNKRNGRKRVEHLQSEFWENEKGRPVINNCKQNRELALKYLREQGEIKGRPSKEQVVKDYLKEHPTEKKVDVIRGTGLSKPTVYKYMK